MKAISILSAIVFAHAAFAQATDSTSVAVSTTDSSSVDAATSTSLVSSTAVATTSASASTSAAVSSSATPSTTGTKTGTKSAGSKSQSATSSANSAAPTSSTWEDGTKTLTSTNGNPLIPSDTSAACSSFLNQMNSDTTLASCFFPVLTKLSTFLVSGSGDPDAVSDTLVSFCASTSCTQAKMGPVLTEFNNACSNDMKNSEVVKNNYDMMYSIIPFKSAMCSKDQTTQKYCLLSAGSGSSNSRRSASNAMYARDHLVNTYVKRGTSQTVFVPNSSTFSSTGLMFLFMSPNMSEAELCTSCTQQIITKYIAFEAANPYALGVANSPLLGGQVALFKAIQNTCPADFSSAVANAGGNTPSANAASPVAAGSALTAFAGALAALVALA